VGRRRASSSGGRHHARRWQVGRRPGPSLRHDSKDMFLPGGGCRTCWARCGRRSPPRSTATFTAVTSSSAARAITSAHRSGGLHAQEPRGVARVQPPRRRAAARHPRRVIARGAAPARHRLLAQATCRTDADCPEGWRCNLSPGICGNYDSLHCETAEDECLQRRRGPLVRGCSVDGRRAQAGGITTVIAVSPG
jgi:hypothetical protein